MKIAVVSGLALALAISAAAAPVRASHKPPAEAQNATADALADGKHAFCKNPPKVLDVHAAQLCPLAKELPDCAPLIAVCDHTELVLKKEEAPKSAPKVPAWLGSVAYVLMIGLIIGIVLMLLVPLGMAFIRSRRDRALSDIEDDGDKKLTTRAPEPLAVTITDAERLLALANDLARRGEYKEALGTYLTACLRAMDHRGLIRFARHRTNGEYVRSCADPGARAELSNVVREVENTEFGGVVPSEETVRRVARSATTLVRTGAFLAAFLLLCSGCDGNAVSAKLGTDPAGMDLLVDVLTRQGMDAAWLGGSLGSLPIPGEEDVAPLVIVDLTRTQLDEEAEEHLESWIEAGGVLIALAPVESSRTLVRVAPSHAPSRDVTIGLRDRTGETFDYPGHVAKPHALLPNDDPDSHKEVRTSAQLVFGVTDPSGAYAIEQARGRGAIVAVANADLFTNVGLAYGHNADAVSAIIEHAFGASRSENFLRSVYLERPIRIARAKDGMTPPNNPATALEHAGLGLGMWHALAATIVLFLAVGIRLSRPKPEQPPTRRAFAEHVEATGALYARAHAATHARTVFARFVDERVRARTAKNLAASDDAIFRATGVTAQNYRDLVSNESGPAGAIQELERLRRLRRVLLAASSHEPAKSGPVIAKPPEQAARETKDRS